ncbi:YeeE/YedE family protein [Neiella marina]|uniref:YeeE/YedE family protein n=1 Tax=Neiella holothuriorum TaxID=2870530 RepID=A0ABS7ECF2_9GAMM|nr:YeeE/YedE family protein [Neiella holothuriorum]MBW8190007.1 YeeE/YedE family protein [Neiella holothuriorum]
MTEFTPISALLGGALIGAGGVLLLLLNGRIAGISGIASQLLQKPNGDWGWRLAFVLGLIVAPWVLLPTAINIAPLAERSTTLIIIAGLLVGMGTNIGSGCTSGHGICGMARLSKRSIVATLVFMTTAIIVVAVSSNLKGWS